VYSFLASLTRALRNHSLTLQLDSKSSAQALSGKRLKTGAGTLFSFKTSICERSAILMIGWPGINCCSLLDNVGKKGAWVVLAVFCARSNRAAKNSCGMPEA
jgi:hypothetical protein